MIRIATKIAYLGIDFCGSQIQPDVRTVEGDILQNVKKLCDLTDEEIDLRLASRTDRNVNALGNVAVFNSDIEDPFTLIKALNAVSEGIFYRSFALVNDSFNPRHADQRIYSYVIPLDGLNVSKMTDCARLFRGEHDFIRFCKPDGKPTVLSVDDVDVSTDGDLVIMRFVARRYLWNMIRRISAAVISVGKGESDISEVETALNGRNTTFGLARADALTLTDITYPDIDFETVSCNMFDPRLKENIFKNHLEKRFFESL
jgi:Pseudouridylate synthase